MEAAITTATTASATATPKNKMLKIVLWSLGGLALVGGAFGIYYKKQYTKILDACYTVSGGIIHTLGLSKVKMTLFFKVVNESGLTIELSNMIFNIYVNNMFVTKITKPNSQTIFSNSDAVVQLDFEFNPKDLLRAGLSNIEPIIYDKEKLIVGIKGSFTGKTGALKFKNMPIDESISLKELLTPSAKAKKC